MNGEIVARLALLAAAALFSTGGLAIKLTELSGWQVSSFRSGLAALLIVLFVPAARQFFAWRIWLVALPYAATFTLYVLGNKYTTAAHTIFLQSTAPLYLMILAPFVLREPAARRDLWFMAALAAGLVLLLASPGEPTSTAPDPLAGDLMAAGAGICWALTLLGLRWLARDDEPKSGTALAAVAAGNLVACLCGLVFVFPVGDTSLLDWSVVLWLGVFQVALAYLLVTRALRRISALQASLLLLLEPVLNPLWVWLALGESPGVTALIGGTVIILATAVHTSTARNGPPG
jgi:drug/metabolite transporter (DMT)-like permease